MASVSHHLRRPETDRAPGRGYGPSWSHARSTVARTGLPSGASRDLRPGVEGACASAFRRRLPAAAATAHARSSLRGFPLLGGDPETSSSASGLRATGGGAFLPIRALSAIWDTLGDECAQRG